MGGWGLGFRLWNVGIFTRDVMFGAAYSFDNRSTGRIELLGSWKPPSRSSRRRSSSSSSSGRSSSSSSSSSSSGGGSSNSSRLVGL